MTRPRQGRGVRLLSLLVAVGLTLGLLGAQALTSQTAQAGNKRLVSGWFGHWTSPSEVLRIARASKGVLGEVNIFMWSYQGSSQPLCVYSGGTCKSGGSTPWTTSNFTESIKGLKKLGIKVYASHTDLSSYYARSLSNYLSSSANRRTLANQMTSWAVKSGVDGVDLDWENFAFNDGSSTWSQTRPRFIKMMKLLSRKLHAKGKKLSVTVPGGYAPFKNGKANPGGGYWVYAWKEIAPYVDRLRLMAYDYSWNRPGPIGPHQWADQVAKAAVERVGRANRRKVYIGVHQYGKSWYARDSKDGYVTKGSCPANWSPSGKDGVTLSPSAARSLASAQGVSPQYNSAHREYTFKYVKSESGTYKSGGTTKTKSCKVYREAWFGDTATAAGRAKIVKKYGIGGIAIWELTAPRSDFYPRLRRFTRPPAKLKVSKSRPRAGSTVKLKGDLPGGKGRVVKRQLKVGGTWKTNAKKRTKAKGKVKFKVRLSSKPRTYQFRLKYSGGKSNVVKVRSR